jgi:hypothetical protein
VYFPERLFGEFLKKKSCVVQCDVIDLILFCRNSILTNPLRSTSCEYVQDYINIYVARQHLQIREKLRIFMNENPF